MNFIVPAYAFLLGQVNVPSSEALLMLVGHCASRVFIITRFEFYAHDYHTISALLGDEKRHRILNKHC